MNNFKCDLKPLHEQCKKEHKPSSFRMQDPNLVFEALQLRPGCSFMDLGCGVGDYSRHASKIVGASGTVYAIDKSESLVNDLQKKVESDKALTNIKPILADIINSIPLGDKSIDVCLIATVLHVLDLEKNGQKLFTETYRVLKPGGHLITIDCKKKESDFGPPLHMRISEEEIENTAMPCGFQKIKTIDLGYNYLIKFIVM